MVRDPPLVFGDQGYLIGVGFVYRNIDRSRFSIFEGLLFEKTKEIREMTVRSFLECLMSVTYINIFTHREFYVMDILDIN